MIKGPKFEIEQKGVYERVWREEKERGYHITFLYIEDRTVPHTV